MTATILLIVAAIAFGIAAFGMPEKFSVHLVPLGLALCAGAAIAVRLGAP